MHVKNWHVVILAYYAHVPSSVLFCKDVMIATLKPLGSPWGGFNFFLAMSHCSIEWLTMTIKQHAWNDQCSIVQRMKEEYKKHVTRTYKTNLEGQVVNNKQIMEFISIYLNVDRGSILLIIRTTCWLIGMAKANLQSKSRILSNLNDIQK